MTFRTEWDGQTMRRIDLTAEDLAALNARAQQVAADQRLKMSCSPSQIRRALSRTPGLRDAVESAVAAGSQDLKDWWEFATVFERMHPEVVAMGAALGKSPEEIDAIFELAVTL